MQRLLRSSKFLPPCGGGQEYFIRDAGRCDKNVARQVKTHHPSPSNQTTPSFYQIKGNAGRIDGDYVIPVNVLAKTCKFHVHNTYRHFKVRVYEYRFS